MKQRRGLAAPRQLGASGCLLHVLAEWGYWATYGVWCQPVTPAFVVFLAFPSLSLPRPQIAIFMGKTDPSAPPHKQQSMILVPMDTPGVKVRRCAVR